MDGSMTENECPVCKDTIKGPSETTQCCKKVFCQSCLTESTRIRLHCPYCRNPIASTGDSGSTGLIGTARVPRFQVPRLIGIDTDFRTTRHVSSNIQQLLRLLQDVQTHQSASSSALNGGPPSQRSPSPEPAVRLGAPAGAQRPTPRPRLHRNVVMPSRTALPPATPVLPAQRPLSLAMNHTSFAPLASDEEMGWAREIVLMESAQRQLSGSTLVRTFQCPYCQQGGLDDLDLRDHCNANHLTDPTPVVCPVCVSLPHGDQHYYSRNFVGHLNLRHCYYIADVTNIQQSDDINMQAAILMSLAPST
ncbi:uncharacterized protein rnf125 [Brachyhypopomus gauderio]|uniref:uncharacterized protein rnf125 n=1 Tax=Brachyhypopomus gauderio TaxID=698409 RepID=UPI0040410D34